MIQRIQTLFLGLAVLLTGAVFFTDLFRRLSEDPSAWLLSAFIAAAAFSMGISAISIFLFSDRPNQIRWAGRAMLFQVIAFAIGLGVFLTLGPINKSLFGEAISLVLLLAALMCQIAARSAIQKDEALVKSIDRIR